MSENISNLIDSALDDLSQETRELLNDNRETAKWLNSVGFGELYSNPPAQRVWVWGGNDSCEIRSYCYREETWARLFKSLHIFGPVQLTVSEINDLMGMRRACIAVISRMGMNDMNDLGFFGPWYRCTTTPINEDLVIELPGSAEDYLRSLGDKTRKHLPYYLRRLKREWGDSFEVTYDLGTDISEDSFSDLVALSRARIENKGSVHLWTGEIIKRRWLLAQQSGLLCGLRFKTNLVGGTLSYLHQNEAYLVLIGHDPQQDNLNLGNVSMWLTIEWLIKMGIKRYHLLWGKSFYKLQFGAKEHALFEVTVFRNPCVAVASNIMCLVHDMWFRTGQVARAMARRIPWTHS